MTSSFFFYDLETSGLQAREARIMQFAGLRTDLNLKPIGEPENHLIALTPDTLPDPDAVLITGITPQATLQDGFTEAAFLKHFTEQIATPGTVFVGYNTVRFDDEFMRALHYRNFYDPYEWQWQDDRSRWDMLDVVRMTRALRPEGIEWPFDARGNPTNRLELLTALNNLEHEHAHDALSDVYATIEVARLIRNKHEQLFEYLFKMRGKRAVAELVEAGQPFVYTSGRYPSEFEKTTVVQALSFDAKMGRALVYDLRVDPAPFKDLTPEQLAEAWRFKKPDEPGLRLPVKTLQYNHCPAVAPLGVLKEPDYARLKLDLAAIKRNLAALKAMGDFPARLRKASELMESARQTSFLQNEQDVDARMYDGFFDEQDRQSQRVVRAADPAELGELGLNFHDERLSTLLPLYKARNYPKQLTSEERATWDAFRKNRLLAGGKNSRMGKYLARLQDIVAKGDLTSHQEYLLEELKLYAESIIPTDDDA